MIDTAFIARTVVSLQVSLAARVRANPCAFNYNL